MAKPTIDTRAMIAAAVIGVIVLILAWHITGLPPGVMWWQAWPFR